MITHWQCLAIVRLVGVRQANSMFGYDVVRELVRDSFETDKEAYDFLRSIHSGGEGNDPTQDAMLLMHHGVI